ncbi:6,7-dimethyl-8-ribityllumazine synthase [Tenacibaculum finnmarkense]|uniref:6,7-dimethyl-8-ribityllumazine synthase n=1 Tax=Tenacibaculum finnmarkense TaxID=2781243 RepID=UPI0007391A68|nr:6,7-dimethyl-8-ribityllumazine synthase [Tenacibaculum finnmarkense]ALU74414.1 6,7-dimethyl-8-ribityllumazine synthase [Tenacibaculum dicentrarchi]MBE7660676.1 6,7-dimethyl-8-ribityllumazine synthase [Tenacibaculum finnmarkense genomovar finnmarkense]MBE7693351.1 6,7-dimethyl-8-ribityllumazine synthase [Tenacibaculum finnmarkense genomovar finnmarkense]MCD8403444.1 6,7-dimethyl-8-ribityllumazine synthase [Tenacibaculum finnmarkense genomovar finnmarkense]MCD8412085.1 6,7-dimethyl-8-ribityll
MATTDLSYYDKATIPNAKSFRFGIVVSEWNPEITGNLHKGAIQALLDCGAEQNNIVSWDVPGSFELVYGCKKMIESQKVDAIIAIGNVIQGQTKHFDFVCDGVTQGIVDLNIKYDVPVIFCVLTDNTKQQSLDRSGGKLGNKGIECAIAAVKMAALKNLDKPSSSLGF